MKTGPELQDEMIQEVTIDRFLDRDPHAIPYTEEELLAFILREREVRTKFEEKARKRKEEE